MSPRVNAPPTTPRGPGAFDLRPTAPAGRPVQKVAFAAAHPYIDPVNPASVAATDILDILARVGFTCEAVSGVDHAAIGPDGIGPLLDAQGLPYRPREALCGPFAARLTYTLRGHVPITLVEPTPPPTTGPADPASTFLACYDKFLETFRRDLLVTSCEIPKADPVVRLAKRRDIPVVVPLLDRLCGDRRAYSNVDYCVVGSEESRRRYWEESGLACVVLPPPGDISYTGQVYADFFRGLGPQPGPPYIPG